MPLNHVEGVSYNNIAKHRQRYDLNRTKSTSLSILKIISTSRAVPESLAKDTLGNQLLADFAKTLANDLAVNLRNRSISSEVAVAFLEAYLIIAYIRQENIS